MHQKQPYDPIISQVKDWPVVQLNRQYSHFLKTVVSESVQALLAEYPSTDALQAMLRKTAELERVRIQKKSWRVDPPDELAFWELISNSLVGRRNVPLPALLHKVVKRYAHEIAGKFHISHYRLGQRAVTYTLAQLLQPVGLRSVRSPWNMYAQLQERIHITGAVAQLRELTRIGTIVMVPTHFSHLDSLVIAWVTHTLGLPHFIYGAGRNLFNSRFFAYFMNNLGTYKIDRRKKNLPYLTTLKTYSSLTLQWGCHSLFYPGGTRSRSGALAQKLKLGLLSTTFEAQRRSYQAQGRNARKLFVVPVVLNYHCVLEAPRLINDYLRTQGLSGTLVSSSYKLLQRATHLFTKDSNIFVSIGQAIDLLGNAVDDAGNSYDAQGAYVDTYQQVLALAPPRAIERQYESCTRALGETITRAYYKDNCVLTSHLVAFSAFSVIEKQHTGLTLQALLQLSPKQLVIAYVALEHAFVQLREAILKLHQLDKIQMEPALQTGGITTMIQQGLRNLGLYHNRKPLSQNRAGGIVIQDMSTLLYYRNKLQGYDLEKHLT